MGKTLEQTPDKRRSMNDQLTCEKSNMGIPCNLAILLHLYPREIKKQSKNAFLFIVAKHW